jgi:hypothetical protein
MPRKAPLSFLIATRLSKSKGNDLVALAQHQGISQTTLVRQSVRLYLKRHRNLFSKSKTAS